MKYYINLFSPNTATAFTNSNRDVTGFRISRKSYVKNQGIKAGDISGTGARQCPQSRNTTEQFEKIGYVTTNS